MFSTQEFIEASRSFVCVRIETYENKEHEKLIRSILNGRYANTAFCIFDPQGEKRLTRSGRSPDQALTGRGTDDDNDTIIKEMNRIAKKYLAKTGDQDAVLQDFLSFGQALNVASADQRLLVFVNADKSATKEIMPTLEELFSDDEVVGRFHLDLSGEEDKEWGKSIKGAKEEPAINIIRASKFGLDGTLVKQLPLGSSLTELKTALLDENKKYSSTEKRKEYAKHVMNGKRSGIKYESAIPYGEDRDGDGKIDGGRSGGAGGDRNGGRRNGGGRR